MRGVQLDLTGKVFGNLTVIALGTKRGTRYYWTCRCKCGTVLEIRNDQLEGRSGCGCEKVSGPEINLIGKKFGRWTVKSREQEKSKSGWRWLCRCDCGNTKVVLGSALRSGHSTSCGCYHKEVAAIQATKMGDANRTHGMAHSTEYVVWKGIIQRCENPAAPAYDSYGGEGIKVCERWHSFENFYADMGPRPSPAHSLDRFPNQKGDYEPGNCRWATQKQQCRNKSNNVMLTYKGRTQCIAAWAEELGVDRTRIWTRYRKGWPIDKIIETPVSKHNVKIGLKGKR